jgi:CBS-domain-containing membrane protein
MQLKVVISSAISSKEPHMTTLAYPSASRPIALRMSLAAELMTPNPLAFHERTPIQKASALLKWHELDAAPVIDDSGRLVGLVTSAACKAWEEYSLRSARSGSMFHALDQATVSEIASPTPVSVIDSASTRVLVGLFLEHRTRRIYVTNECGELVGVISMSDVLRSLK